MASPLLMCQKSLSRLSLFLSSPHRAVAPLIVIFQGGSERRLTATRRCLIAGMTEEIRGAARLITGFLSSVGNKILITPHDAPGSSRQMDVGFSAVPTRPGWKTLPAAASSLDGACREAGWPGQGSSAAPDPVVSLREDQPLGPDRVGQHV